MSPSAPLCNPLDVFRVRDPEADAVALRLTYHASHGAARTADAIAERLVETRRALTIAGVAA